MATPKSVTKPSVEPRDQPVADEVERLLRRRLQTHVVDAAAPEHRRLVFGLGVPRELEHVELGVRADGHERQATLLVAVTDRLVGEHLGVEHVAVERVETIGVLGEHGHVVDACQQHDRDRRTTRYFFA